MIVVDTNIIAYLLLPGEFTEQARRVFQLDPEWVAPALWRSELRNVLVMEMRRNQLPLAPAMEMMHAAEELLDEGTYDVSSEGVLRLAHESACSAYDCEFVALALSLQVDLVTVDKKVLAAFPRVAVSPDAYPTRT